MLRDELKKEISRVAGADIEIKLVEPERSENGDYSTNLAFLLAKKKGKSPNDIAEEVAHKLRSAKSDLIDRADSVGGFVNVWVKDEALIKKLSKKLKFDKQNKKINVEFVSANPTGPLTMANGRGGFYGDALANVLEAAGHKVTREYYINDAGNQIKLLGESILAAEGKIPQKDEYYKGGYIKELKGKSAEAATKILLGEIKKSLKKAGIKFNVWFSEADIRKKNGLKKVLEFLNKKKLIKEKEGALWLGDAVVVKSSKEPTYFLADLAYHYDKFIKRKFDFAINIWGADHHGYVERMKKGVEALGVNSERLKMIIMQLVRLTSGGKEARMCKRAGEFITLDDLLKEVGVNSARWFFLERSPDTHMDFDLDLARERSKKNPVYYVQYAHVRCHSILKKAQISKSKLRASSKTQISKLDKPEELNLIKKILQLPEIIEDVTSDYQVHRLPRYAYELAQTFTNFYEKYHVIDSKNPELTQTRLFLVSVAQ